MSAILEALRRVEREAPPPSAQSMPQRVDPRKTFRQRIRRIWLIRRALTFLFVLFVLVISGWVATRFLPWTGRDLTPEITASAERGDDISSTQIVWEKSDQKDGHFPSEKRRWVDPARWGDREEPGPTVSSGQPAKREPGVRPTKQPVQRFPKEVREISPIDPDSGFKLEALVWSTNPESRFAVINGRMVKAGQSVRGATVTEIERDYVGLNYGDKKLELRIQALP